MWQMDLALRLLQRTGASPRESHEKPGNGYEVSTAELDALVEIAPPLSLTPQGSNLRTA